LVSNFFFDINDRNKNTLKKKKKKDIQTL